MKIVILGAGNVGMSILQNLNDEDIDMVIIDTNKEKLDYITSKFDVLTVQGSATNIQVLEHANIAEADLVIAATNSDEINILACKIASSLYNVRYKIARLRDRQYLRNKDILFTKGIVDIDYIIEPTMIIAEAMHKLIRYPGIENYFSFCNERVAMYICEAQYGGSFIGKLDIQCQRELANNNIALLGILRKEQWISVGKGTPINAGDKLILCSDIDVISDGVSRFQRLLTTAKKVMLAGGSKVNYYLAQKLSEDGVNVKLIEHDPIVAERLSSSLPKVIVVRGDSTDEHLLFEERVDWSDLFLAATSDDNINIFSCVIAKRLGSKRVVSLINRVKANFFSNYDVDLLYSGQNEIANIIRSQSHVTNFAKIYRDNLNRFQLAELVVDESFAESIIGVHINDLKLPSGVKVVGYFRYDMFFVVHDDSRIELNDRLIVLCDDNKDLRFFNSLTTRLSEQ